MKSSATNSRNSNSLYGNRIGHAKEYWEKIYPILQWTIRIFVTLHVFLKKQIFYFCEIWKFWPWIPSGKGRYKRNKYYRIWAGTENGVREDD